MKLFLFTFVSAVKAATPITTVAPELFNGWINLGASPFDAHAEASL
jgi:hypothetical protein